MANVDADPLFTLDVVRDFINAQGGKVSNHVLVTHFKSFLNDSQKKDANRLKFKEYVNTLAVVKVDTSGEKVLALKKKYRDSGSFLVRDTSKQAGATNAVAGNRDKGKVLDGAKYAKMQQKLRAEKQKALLLAGKSNSEGDLTKSSEETESCLKIGSCDNLDSSITDTDTAGFSVDSKSDATPCELEKPLDVSDLVVSLDKSGDDTDKPPSDDAGAVLLSDTPFISPAKNYEVTIDSDEHHTCEASLPVDKENINPVAEPASLSNTADQVLPRDDPVPDVRKTEKRPFDDVDRPSKTAEFSMETSKRPTPSPTDVTEVEMVSVRDRAQHLNQLEQAVTSATSPVIRPPPVTTTAAKVKQRESRRPDDSSCDFTMTSVEREWTMRSAYSDYQAMAKLLQSNADLAGRRDFVTGLTALHWAAKNGKPEVVKLLFGSAVPPHVDARSNGGYTPLHFATMHGREDVIDLLVEVYKADTSIRDYSGRKPKYYASNISAKCQQLLQSRRGDVSGMQHSASYNSRIGRSVQPTAIPTSESWSHPSPNSSPGPGSRKGSVSSDSGLMPPPRELPALVRRRPIASTSTCSSSSSVGVIHDKESLSDSEMHRAGSENDLHGSESVPNFGTFV